MADRKPLLGQTPARPELNRLLEKARHVKITEEQLHEQRVSFAYGNAPADSGITKDSARKASNNIRILET